MGYFKKQNVEIQEFIEKELREKGYVIAHDVFERFSFLDENNPNDHDVIKEIYDFVLEELEEEES